MYSRGTKKSSRYIKIKKLTNSKACHRNRQSIEVRPCCMLTFTKKTVPKVAACYEITFDLRVKRHFVRICALLLHSLVNCWFLYVSVNRFFYVLFFVLCTNLLAMTFHRRVPDQKTIFPLKLVAKINRINE